MPHNRRGEATGAYPRIRAVLGPEYRRRSDSQIEALVAEAEMDPESLESFLGTLGKIGQAVARAAPAVLPVAGAALGTVIGGPAGTAVGGALGNMAGQAVGRATARGGAAAPHPQQGARPQAAAGLGSGGSPAAAQLLQIIQRPEIQRALMAMVMGQPGRRSFPIAGAQVPTAALAGLVGTLANQAVAEYSAAVPPPAGGAAYLYDYAGEAMGDPALPEARAARLLELLHEADVEQDEGGAEATERRGLYDDGADEDEPYREALGMDGEADLLELYLTVDTW